MAKVKLGQVMPETGTWTPTLFVGGTYTEQSGSYFKIGNIVTANFSVAATSPSNTSGVIIVIRGLPYKAKFNAGGGGDMLRVQSGNYPNGYNISAGGELIAPSQMTASGVRASISASASTTYAFSGTISYIAAE